MIPDLEERLKRRSVFRSRNKGTENPGEQISKLLKAERHWALKGPEESDNLLLTKKPSKGDLPLQGHSRGEVLKSHKRKNKRRRRRIRPEREKTRPEMGKGSLGGINKMFYLKLQLIGGEKGTSKGSGQGKDKEKHFSHGE